MRCPGCRKAIPVEALKHEDCGWNVHRGSEVPVYEGERAPPEIAGKYVRDMKRRNAEAKVSGVRYWQQFLTRVDLTPFQRKFADDALNALRFRPREPGEDDEALAA